MRNSGLVWHGSWLVMLILILMLCSCAGKPVITLTGADTGATVELKSGQILTVSLEAQLGTGYGWAVVSRNDNIVPEGEPMQEPVGGARPGGLEIQKFRFRASAAGESDLALHYVRGWEKNSKPLKEFIVTVIVK